MYPTILLCLGLDIRDEHLVQAFAERAPALGARRVLLMHVYPHEPLPWEVGGSSPVASADGAASTVNLWVRELARRLPGVEVVGLHAIGQPYEEIVRVEQAEKVDLMVLGRAATGTDHPSQGIRGRAILRYTAATALVAPEGTALGCGTAVVGLDFSDASIAALAVASRLYRRVVAVYAYQVDHGLSYGGRTSEEFVHHLVDELQRHFADEVLPALPATPQPPELRLVEDAMASEALLKAARDVSADTIVMGSHGQTRIAALLLGSTAERLTARSHVPVLVVRKPGARQGILGSLLHR